MMITGTIPRVYIVDTYTMSALLNLPAVAINLNAECYYSARSFQRVPEVFFAEDYRSCMFLVYTNDRITLPNRMKNYRNHFVLYSDGRSLLLVRTETTLVYEDNDAVLTYELIIPSDTVTDRYYTCRKPWSVSFDRISFSNKRPGSFIGYRMVCSGEWWFFDKGFVLNGTTSAITTNSDCVPCKSMFIYFELHRNYKISRNRPIVDEPHMNHLASRIPETDDEKTDKSKNTDKSDDGPQQRKRAKLDSVKLPEDVITESDKISRFVSTITSKVMSTQLRQPAVRNDETEAPVIKYMTVLPSLYWFNARAQELDRGDISYFLPRDAPCKPDVSITSMWEPTPTLSMFH